MAKRLPKLGELPDYDPEKHGGKKVMVALSVAQVRDFAARLDAIARKLHDVADDMKEMRISRIHAIPQALETILSDELPPLVKREFIDRLSVIVKKQGKRSSRRDI